MRPFPFAQLPRWTAAEVARVRAVLRRLAPATTPTAAWRDALAPAWTALLGGPARAAPLAPALVPPDAVRARYEGRALACVMDHRALGPLAALLDAPLGHALAARALGADDEGARRAAAARGYPPAHEGALALVCAQAAVLACAPAPPPTVRAVSERVGDALEALGGDAPGAAPFTVWPWRVSVGAMAGEVALLVPSAALLRAPEPGADPARSLGDATVSAALVAARSMMPAAEVASMFEGDVLLLEDAPGAARLALGPDGALAGEMVLALGEAWVPVTCSPGGQVTVAGPARAKGSGSVVDTDERVSGAGAMAAGGGNADEPGAVRTEVLAALPVEVEVVIARGAFAVGEVAAWRVGEVLALPTALGEPVLVRAGGRPVARGELCEVDGAVGVRVTEML